MQLVTTRVDRCLKTARAHMVSCASKSDDRWSYFVSRTLSEEILTYFPAYSMRFLSEVNLLFMWSFPYSFGKVHGLRYFHKDTRSCDVIADFILC